MQSKYTYIVCSQAMHCMQSSDVYIYLCSQIMHILQVVKTCMYLPMQSNDTYIVYSQVMHILHVVKTCIHCMQSSVANLQCKNASDVYIPIQSIHAHVCICSRICLASINPKTKAMIFVTIFRRLRMKSIQQLCSFSIDQCGKISCPDWRKSHTN